MQNISSFLNDILYIYLHPHCLIMSAFCCCQRHHGCRWQNDGGAGEAGAARPRQRRGSLPALADGQAAVHAGSDQEGNPASLLPAFDLKSFSYGVHALVIVAALLYAALVWIPTLPTVLQLGAWPLYWVVQGCVMNGIWVIAHECGHHALSDYLLLDNMVRSSLSSCLV